MEDLTLLPLHKILLHNGFKLNKDKSSRSNPVLENERETIVITKKGDNYLYFNRDGSNDRGNIINFCRNRKLDIKVLIQNYHNGGSIDIKIPKYFEQGEDYREILHKYNKLNPYNPQKNQFFINRGIYDVTIKPYIKSFKQDNYGNICFPHYKLINNIITICGYTQRLSIPLYKDKEGNPRKKPLKNINYGMKCLEVLNINPHQEQIKYILFSESIIDALSFMQLYKDKYNPEEMMLISTNGNFASEGKELEGIQPTLNKILDYCKDARIITAFDNDKDGLKFTQFIEKYTLEKTKKNIFIYKPFCKDVNDDLRLKQITQLKKLDQQNFQIYLENQLLGYQRHSDTNYRKNILEKIRKIDSIKPLNESYKERFNQIKKHKSIKKL